MKSKFNNYPLYIFFGLLYNVSVTGSEIVKSKKSKRIFTIVFMVIVLFVAVKVYVDFKSDIAAYEKRIADLEQKLDEQEQYKKELDNTEDVYSSQEAVEQIARDTLGLVKSDEKFFKNYNDNQ